MFIAIMCLGLTSIPNVFSQSNANIQVLSYSWYISSSGNLTAVGEVQNLGNSVIQSVYLNAQVYTSNQTVIAASSTRTYGDYLIPQQKAPFYIDFGQPPSSLGLNWESTVGSIQFTVTSAPPSSNNVREYQNLNGSINFQGPLNGVYVIGGLIRNNGNQTADNIRVIGTYYDNSGKVVAVGFNNVTSSLIPDNATSFMTSEFNITPSTVIAEISKASILVQTTTLQNGTSLLPTATPTTTSGTSGSFPTAYYYVIVAVVVVAVIIIALTLLMLRRRKTASAPLPPPPPTESQ